MIEYQNKNIMPAAKTRLRYERTIANILNYGSYSWPLLNILNTYTLLNTIGKIKTTLALMKMLNTHISYAILHWRLLGPLYFFLRMKPMSPETKINRVGKLRLTYVDSPTLSVCYSTYGLIRNIPADISS